MTIRITDVEPGIQVLAIDRPDTRNAFDTRTYRVLADSIAAAEADPHIDVIILTGHGGIFTSGNDMADFRDQKGFEEPLALLHLLISADKPVIAAVEGYAIGIGTTMLLHCDLAYAGRSTIFSVPFVKLGLSAEAASTLLLPKIAGDKRAAEMLLLGGRFDAARAETAGLINSVVDDGAALTVAIDTARSLRQIPTEAVRTTKRLMRRNRSEVLQVIEDEAVVFRERAASPEALQAFDDFLQSASQRPAVRT
ncbi:enoyl-CoA hydratase-related protein [Nocardia sp. bgisy134]|uniref:enoyl-CoA hydratase-related protein n=1 Tax=Nocardia sp. bgisy134 TaxID=3413789 RepID=UPI003D73A2E8